MPRDTAFAKAFEDAGFRSPRDRLDEITDQALAGNCKSMEDVRVFILSRVAGASALLWEMYSPFQAKAVSLLVEAANARRKQAEQETQKFGAKPNPQKAIVAAPQRPAGKTGGTLIPQSAGQAAANHTAHVISALDRITIYGKRIGSVTVYEARNWHAADAVKRRFVELLTANLPGNAVIEDYVKPDEADRLLARVVEEMRHAA